MRVTVVFFIVILFSACTSKPSFEQIQTENPHLKQAFEIYKTEQDLAMQMLEAISLAGSFLACHDSVSALKIARQAMAISTQIPKSKHPVFQVDLIEILLKLGQIDEAKHLYTSISQKDARSKTAVFFAAYFTRTRQFHEAKAWLRRIRTQGELVQAWRDVLIADQANDSLNVLFQTVSKHIPLKLQPNALYEMALFNIKKEKLKQALEIGQEMYRYQKKQGTKFRYLEVKLYLALSNAYRASGERAEANKLLKLAEAITEKLPPHYTKGPIFVQLTDFYLKQGILDQALIYLKLARETLRLSMPVNRRLSLLAALYHRYNLLSSIHATDDCSEEAFWMTYKMEKAIKREYLQAKRKSKPSSPIIHFNAASTYQAALALFLAEQLTFQGEVQTALNQLRDSPECYLPNAYLSLASIQIDRGRLSRVQSLIDKAQNTCYWRLNNHPLKKSETMLQMMDVYLKLNREPMALEVYKHIPLNLYKVKALGKLAHFMEASSEQQ